MLRKLRRRGEPGGPRPLDVLILALAAGAVALSALAVYGGQGGELRVVIDGAGGEWIYPLDQDRQLRVEGPLGASVVRIEGGQVHIESSPCPNQTCVSSGSRAGAGQWLACLPNEVFVRVEGGATEDGVDAGVY